MNRAKWFIGLVILGGASWAAAADIEPILRYDVEADAADRLHGSAQIVADLDGGNGKPPGRVLQLGGEDGHFDGSDPALAKVTEDFAIALWVRTPYPPGARRWSPSGQGLVALDQGLTLLYTARRHTPPISVNFARGLQATVDPADEREQYQWSALDATWRHVVLTYEFDRGHATLFIDGKIDKTYDFAPKTPIPFSEGRMIIGAVLLHGRPAGSLIGYIDDVCVYDQALSRDQIVAMIDLQQKWITDDPAVSATLPLEAGERTRLLALEQAGVQTIRPVRLPFGEARTGRNDHLGWPIATMIDDTIIVHYHRIVAHHGSPREDADSRHTLIIRSTDGGQTWSDPMDLAQWGVTSKPMAFGMAAIGQQDGDVFLATAQGLYASADKGATWRLIPDALTLEQVGPKRFGRAHNAGPSIVTHPRYGLILPVGIERDPAMNLYHSNDRGATWTKTQIELPDERVHPLEPTAMVHKRRLVFLSRNHALPFRFHHVLHDTSRPCFLVSGENEMHPLAHFGVTDIASHRWPDTTALNFNPVTKRFEAVVTNRNGGIGDEETDIGQQTVNLWSIAEEELLAGRGESWRFEATLMRFEHGMGDNAAGSDVDAIRGVDAAHPGAAVIDVKRGEQHIFIYAGQFRGPAGIYRITRTLDTEKLRHALPRVEP